MKNVSFAVAVLFAARTLASAQTGPTGSWGVDGVGNPFPWKGILVADGSRLFGAVSSCSSGPGAYEIYEGKIEGNTITFKCTSPVGQSILTFTGTVKDDEIVFAWELRGPGAANNALFGASAPPRFTAKRIPAAVDFVTEMADYSARIHRDRAVTFDRIIHADREPQNWLTYSGSLRGQRYSPLTQITPANVKNLELAWLWQSQSPRGSEATALVVDGILYTVESPNDVIALDAVTGRSLWTYSYTPAPRARASGGGGRPNRGLAIHGDTLFLGTLDAHLLAINAVTGKLIWNTTVADAADPTCRGRLCYVITHAPLVVKDKVIVGVAGSEGPIRGFIAAFDVTTGKEVWRFYTIPASGEAGSETWSGDSWKTGGGGVWNTGAYDADLNLTYWGTGNPFPPLDGKTRVGANLYSDCVVALDADTGKLKWHYQFTPHDTKDWDAAQIPVLTEMVWQGQPRKVMLWANRNGIMYALDRTTGQFLYGKPFVQVNWMDGFDAVGRPVQVPAIVDSEKALTFPGISATNWKPPSYSLSTGLFYIPAWERGAIGIFPQRGPGYGAIRAIDPKTGDKKWEFKRNDANFMGVLTTASDLLFTGVDGDDYSGLAESRRADRYFYALDARTGQILWQMALTGGINSGPMSYSVGGQQFIAVIAGNTLFAFALRQ